MSRLIEENELVKVRRKDRMEGEPFIKNMLIDEPFASISIIQDDRPYTMMNIFYYSEVDHAIYFHTGAKGRFRLNTERESNVCFTIGKMGRLLPADVALEFSVEYESVVVFGQVSIVTDEENSKIALQLLLDKYFPHLIPDHDYRSTTDAELKRTTVYKIDITHWSGKKKKEASEFPGAFYYKEDIK